MSEDLIRYDILAQDALRGVVKTVLTEVARTGLPGEHHFYITFNTQAPGVRISPRLLEKYPDDMTIVLQHQFWDLQANDQAIEIGLSFDGIPEKLYIPYTAIITFIDPSVHFSLQFEIEMEEEIENPEEQGEGGDDDVLTVLAPNEEEFSMPAEPATSDDKKESASDDEESSDEADKADKEKEGAEVVSLDAFRKK
ncbi:SspB family protein [uncultured Cohaesibacter sp.]|uniref:SspB family protein n=1 Tax=uncultured Cohaesibacter sp. TaxID=1002546 RepID=UPI002AAB659E|nr:SspB family protein [uncultured Cohaesibacter sp.]